MPHSNFSSQRRQIESVRRQFGQADGLPFDQVLSAEQIEEALRAENVSWREIVFTPVVTLWASAWEESKSIEKNDLLPFLSNDPNTPRFDDQQNSSADTPTVSLICIRLSL